ncbi:hypothetical protein HT105_23890, partial [Bacteroides fragilis]|nr:hypothetical protein [Bacteroides fragilis]
RTAERWEKLDEIPGWVETALRKITFATQMWESDLQDAGQVMIHTGGYRMLDGRPLPESWWIHLVGQAMRTAERWEKLDEIPGWVETALRKITFATQMWES